MPLCICRIISLSFIFFCSSLVVVMEFETGTSPNNRFHSVSLHDQLLLLVTSAPNDPTESKHPTEINQNSQIKCILHMFYQYHRVPIFTQFCSKTSHFQDICNFPFYHGPHNIPFQSFLKINWKFQNSKRQALWGLSQETPINFG